MLSQFMKQLQKSKNINYLATASWIFFFFLQIQKPKHSNFKTEKKPSENLWFLNQQRLQLCSSWNVTLFNIFFLSFTGKNQVNKNIRKQKAASFPPIFFSDF